MANGLEAVSHAANLALRMSRATADVAVAMADIGEGLPWVGGVLTAVRTIRDKVEAATSNKNDLDSLHQRCTYMIACVIVKCQRCPSVLDVSPLIECVRQVDQVVEHCGQRGWLKRVIKSKEDKDEIAELDRRLGNLTTDLGLAGVVAVEGKVDNLKRLLQRIVDNQERRHAEQMAELTDIKAIMQKTTPKQAQVPKGTPARQSWYVRRERVQQIVCEELRRGGSPRIVGLVGESGSGKTTAACELVRSGETLEFFSDGIVWLTVNNGAKDRLSSLMWQLATMLHDDILGSTGPVPAGFGDGGVAYIKKRVEKGNGGKGYRCLVVADDVWDAEVMVALRETGMWVLATTRNELLLEDVDGESVGIDKLSKDSALSVLRGASELPTGTPLPDSALELVELCGHLAMNIAFVGRWSAVRKREDPSAWSRAAASIRTELKTLKINATIDSPREVQSQRRISVLRAGFRYLGAVNDHVQWLYLALAVMPDGHLFSLRDATVLVYGQEYSPEDEQAVENVLDILERWSIVRAGDGARTHRKYCTHDAHLNFARESLKDRGDIRRPAVDRWVEHISSLEVLTCMDRYELTRLWRVVKVVGGKGCRVSRPYDGALSSMDDSDFEVRRKGVLKVMGFREANEDWEGAYDARRRLLGMEQQTLGTEHGHVANTLRLLADLAERIGHSDEAKEWRRQQTEALDAAICAKDRSLGAEDMDLSNLHSLATTMMESGRQDEAEQLFRQAVEVCEAKVGPDDERVGYALHSLGVCVRRRGRMLEAEKLLERSLSIKRTTVGPESAAVAYTLHNLGMCMMRLSGREEEAVKHLTKSLHIFEVQLGQDDLKLVGILHKLGMCAKAKGRYEQAIEFFTRGLRISKAKLEPNDWRILRSRRQLNRCIEQSETR